MSNFNVTNVEDAQTTIAELLVRFSGETAYDRLVIESRFAKQTVEEIAFRTAGNLLRSSVTRKPGGAVSFF